jgi:hypothetical protein
MFTASLVEVVYDVKVVTHENFSRRKFYGNTRVEANRYPLFAHRRTKKKHADGLHGNHT